MKFPHHQKTKIVATVGPASDSYEKLLALVRAGVDVFRINMSHGEHENIKEVIRHINKINEKYGVHIGVLADLQGPKLRVGKIQYNGIEIKKGDILTFTNKECVGTKEAIYMSYRQFAKDVNVGERVLVDDGKIVLEVQETDAKSQVKLKVIFGGILSSNKGVNLPDTKVSLPSLTTKDKKDLEFILTQPVNWIALSFVRSANDVKGLKRRIAKAEHPAKVIAKVEKPEAIDNIKAIVKA
ncbi:MAG: pyruvate kinase, partial [Saprospiraceae bacterium]|nr:pyruvate kinase [Saprospiraceae bacterium]